MPETPKEPEEPSRKEPKEPSRERERTPDSPKLRSKESKKADKHKKKEPRRRRRRSESDEHDRKSRSRKDERSRSTRRSDPPMEQPLEIIQTDVTSTAEDLTTKGGPQLALTDKPARTRPRFDTTVEHAVGRKIAERSARGRLTHLLEVD